MLPRAMVRRPAVAVLAAATLFAPLDTAGAQTRTVVVPADAAVVVPPRGSALPRPAPKPVAHRPRLPPMPLAREERGAGLGGVGTVAAVVLPAIAAAAVVAALSSGNGGAGGHTTSGPVRTR
jgi:hypothetical protein